MGPNAYHVLLMNTLKPQVWHVKIAPQTVYNVLIVQCVKYVTHLISTWWVANVLIPVPKMEHPGMETNVSIVLTTSTLMRLNWNVLTVLIIASNVLIVQYVNNVILPISTYLMEFVLMNVLWMGLSGMEVNVKSVSTTNSTTQLSTNVTIVLLTASNVIVVMFAILAILPTSTYLTEYVLIFAP